MVLFEIPNRISFSWNKHEIWNEFAIVLKINEWEQTTSCWKSVPGVDLPCPKLGCGNQPHPLGTAWGFTFFCFFPSHKLLQSPYLVLKLFDSPETIKNNQDLWWPMFLKDFPLCSQYFEDSSLAYFWQNCEVMVIWHHICTCRNQAVVSAGFVPMCDFLRIPFVGDLWDHCLLQGIFTSQSITQLEGADRSWQMLNTG